MTESDKQNDNNVSSLINQIQEQLVCICISILEQIRQRRKSINTFILI